MEYTDILNSSLCKHCDHKVIRDISSEGLQVLYDEDYIEDEEVESFIHVSCSKLCIDLDHIVLDCNKFKYIKENNNNESLLKNDDIVNDLC